MKKIDELKQQLEEIKGEVRSLNDAKKVEEAEAKLAEMRSLKSQIEIQEELDKEEIRGVENKMEKREIKKEELEIRTVFTKAVQGKALSPEERALVQSSVNTDGGYLVPVDIANEINVLKRQYKSALMCCADVVKVGTETGTFVIEDLSTLTGLVNFDEDNTGLAETQPKFRNVEYKIANYGAVTPISRTFLQDEASNFMSYLTSYFARKAVRTENAKIFETLKIGKTAKVVATINDIKKIVNKDIDPAIKAMSVVCTNQDGFNFLDELEDLNGRPLLQMNPANPTEYRLLGMTVYVFSNAELPTVTGKAPVFLGALTEGVKFFDRGVYEIAVSTEAGFTKNQTVARVVERFDVKQADVDAYVLAEVTIA